MSATFKLKCVGCGMFEDRPADECCGDQPMCNKCYMPMVLVTVSLKPSKKRAGKERTS